MAPAAAETRKRTRASTAGDACSTAPGEKKRTRTGPAEWIKVLRKTASHALRSSLWCVRTPSRVTATDPAPMSRVVLLEYESDSIPVDHEPSIRAEYATWTPPRRAATPDTTPPTPCSSTVSSEFSFLSSMDSDYTPLTVSPGYAQEFTPWALSEYAPWSGAASSTDHRPRAPCNSPCLSDYGAPMTPKDSHCSPLSPSSPQESTPWALPEYTPWSGFGSPDPTPRSPCNSPTPTSPHYASLTPSRSDCTPLMFWSHADELGYATSSPPEYASWAMSEYAHFALSSGGASPNPTTPRTPWNSPALPDFDFTPVTPTRHATSLPLSPATYTPWTQSEFLTLTPLSGAAWPGYTSSLSPEYAPSVPPNSPMSPDDTLSEPLGFFPLSIASWPYCTPATPPSPSSWAGSPDCTPSAPPPSPNAE